MELSLFGWSPRTKKFNPVNHARPETLGPWVADMFTIFEAGNRVLHTAFELQEALQEADEAGGGEARKFHYYLGKADHRLNPFRTAIADYTHPDTGDCVFGADRELRDIVAVIEVFSMDFLLLSIQNLFREVPACGVESIVAGELPDTAQAQFTQKFAGIHQRLKGHFKDVETRYKRADTVSLLSFFRTFGNPGSTKMYPFDFLDKFPDAANGDAPISDSMSVDPWDFLDKLCGEIDTTTQVRRAGFLGLIYSVGCLLFSMYCQW